MGENVGKRAKNTPPLVTAVLEIVYREIGKIGEEKWWTFQLDNHITKTWHGKKDMKLGTENWLEDLLSITFS